MTSREDAERLITLAALFALVVGCVVIMRPFITAVLWAAILTSSTWPLYQRLHTLTGGRRTLAAGLMTLSVTLVLLAPFVIVGVGLVQNTQVLVDTVRNAVEHGIGRAPAWITDLPLVGDRLRDFWNELAVAGTRRLEEFTSRVGELLMRSETLQQTLLKAAKLFASGVLDLTMSVLVAFFLYRDGEAIERRVLTVAEKLGGDRAHALLGVAGTTVNGVIYGILGTALAQGILAAIGFVIAGVPAASLLGLLTFFLSAVPVGPPLVWVPAAFWLLHQGETGWAVFLFLYGLLVISAVDNIIKPLIISQGSHLPFVLVLIGVLGGALAFGLIGVFLGPTLMAIGFRLLQEWSAPKGPAPVTEEVKAPTPPPAA